MDKYYGNVCELDIIFNFQKAYFILDELLLAGEMQESSKKNVLRCISQQDSLEDMEVRFSLLTLNVHVLVFLVSLKETSRLLSFFLKSLSQHNIHFQYVSVADFLATSIRSRMRVSRRSCDTVYIFLDHLYIILSSVFWESDSTVIL